MSAYDELMGFLEDGEYVERVVFGPFGWDPEPEKGRPVPIDKIGIVLTLEEAKLYMFGWNFFGGYGAPNCHATYVWTNTRVIWVTQYDGSTSLSSMPRNPVDCIPYMPGG